MMNKIVGYSWARTIMNRFSFLVQFKQMSLYNFFENLNSRLRNKEEKRENLSGLFGVPYSIPTG